MRNRTAIGGTTFAQLNLYAHVPGLIVLSAGTHEDARNMLHAALQSTDPVILFDIFLIEYGKRNSEEATPVTITEAKVEKEKIFRLLLTVLRFINA
jgi:pyruvate/2-oxoglutarate/acetoin dehydrogenase E1 component